MAVLLAQQWHTKNQALPDELTFSTFVTQRRKRDISIQAGTNKPSGEIGNDDTGNINVPGGLGGDKGFINFWNEYTLPAPFVPDDGPDNTRGTPMYFSVPDSQSMSIESVEVKVSIEFQWGRRPCLITCEFFWYRRTERIPSSTISISIPTDPGTAPNVTPWTYACRAWIGRQRRRFDLDVHVESQLGRTVWRCPSSSIPRPANRS